MKPELGSREHIESIKKRVREGKYKMEITDQDVRDHLAHPELSFWDIIARRKTRR